MFRNLIPVALIVAISGSLYAAEKTNDEGNTGGKVVWPAEYVLEISRPRIDIGEGKNYLAGVVQNLINDELFLQRSAITRGKILPLRIEYSVQKHHENLPPDERGELLSQFKKPVVLPLKIVRSAESYVGKLNCEKISSSNAYKLYAVVSGTPQRLKLEVLLCHGKEVLTRQSTAIDEQELVSAVTRLMNPVRAKLTGDNYASLHVDTLPLRASVYIDDQFLGKTPLKYSYLIPGKYKLSIKKDGFQEATETILPATNETMRRNFQLVQATAGGTIDITTDPPGAKIYLDADYKGVTPKKLENITLGMYRLHLLHPEKGEVFKSVTLSEKNNSLEVNEKLSGFLADKKPGLWGLSYKSWYWVTLGVSAASFGTAIGCYVWRDQAQEEIYARLSGKPATSYTADDTAFLADRRSVYSTRENYATVFMVSAGLFAALSIWAYIEHLFAPDDSIVMKEPRQNSEYPDLRMGARVGGGELSANIRF